jgi:hypothetical protein
VPWGFSVSLSRRRSPFLDTRRVRDVSATLGVDPSLLPRCSSREDVVPPLASFRRLRVTCEVVSASLALDGSIR